MAIWWVYIYTQFSDTADNHLMDLLPIHGFFFGDSCCGMMKLVVDTKNNNQTCVMSISIWFYMYIVSYKRHSWHIHLDLLISMWFIHYKRNTTKATIKAMKYHTSQYINQHKSQGFWSVPSSSAQVNWDVALGNVEKTFAGPQIKQR